MLNIYTITSDESNENIDNIMIKVIAKAIYNSIEFQKILMPKNLNIKKIPVKDS